MGTVDSHYFPLPLRLDPLGFCWLDGELTVPAESKALILVPHAVNFRTDECLHNRLAEFHHRRFATWVCNIKHLQDALSPESTNGIQWLTMRLVHILQIKRGYALQGLLPAQLPTLFSVAGKLVAPAIRAAVIQDKEIQALICWNGLIGDAGHQYLQSLSQPVFHQDSQIERYSSDLFDWISKLQNNKFNTTNRFLDQQITKTPHIPTE